MAISKRNGRCGGASRRKWLLCTTAVAVFSTIITAQPVSGANECGPIAGGSVSCTSAGNDYTSGISYTPADDLTLVVEDGVVIAPNSGLDGIAVDSANDAVHLTISDGATITTQGNLGDGVLIRDASQVTLSAEGDITTSGSFTARGIYVDDTAGNVVITSLGRTATSGNFFSHGIYASDTGGDLSISLSEGASVETTGAFSDGIRSVDTEGNVNISLSADSVIETAGGAAQAIFVRRTDGNVAIDLASESVIDTQTTAIGLLATEGSTTIAASGDIITHANYAYGIYVAASAAIEITAFGNIETHGHYAIGIFLSYNDGEIAIDIDSAASISTEGDHAHGIFVRPVYDHDVNIAHSGAIITEGDQAYGIYIRGHNDPTGGDVTITTASQSLIATSGESAHGILIYGRDTIGGNVTVDVSGIVYAVGENAYGISVTGVQGAVSIGIDGYVYGRSAGVQLDNPDAVASELTILDGGSLGATSDVAIIDGAEALTIFNYGTITGTVELGAGDDVFYNYGSDSWQLPSHDFAPVADFGAGTADAFYNYGKLSLLKRGLGLWHGQIIGLESFLNGADGSIWLADGVAGDTLSISGTFTSAGGALYLDVDTATPAADLLTLATVALGGDPTIVHLASIGAGDTPTSDPILLIDADALLTPEAEDAFALSTTVIGAYRYKLLYDDTDIAWYLQNIGLWESAADYPALMSGLLWSFASDVDALHERLKDGHTALSEEEDAPGIVPAAWSASAPRFSPWLQVAGARQESDSGPAFDQQILKLEGGVDGRFETAAGARYVMGAFAGSGRLEQDFAASAARLESDLALAGLYAGFSSGGFYGQALFKYEHHWADFRGESTNGEASPFAVDLWGGSLESGYRFTRGKAYLRPRLRLTYAEAAETRFTDAAGETVTLAAADSLAGEAAVRLGLHLPQELGFADLHLEAGLHHEMRGETEAEVSDLFFTAGLPGTLGLLSAGASAGLFGDAIFLSLDLGYARGEDADEITATGALRMIF